MMSRKTAAWWAGVGVYAIVLLLLSVVRLPETPSSVTLNDSIAHGMAYSGFGWLMIRALRASHGARRQLVLYAAVFAAGYGACCEGLQAFVPYRSAEGMDLIANSVGALLGSGLGTWP